MNLAETMKVTLEILHMGYFKPRATESMLDGPPDSIDVQRISRRNEFTNVWKRSDSRETFY